MPNRYADRPLYRNKDDMYEKFFERRGKKYIRQYGTGMLSYPTVKEVAALTRAQHIWKAGDRYYKLAIKYYGDAQYWWVIALFNRKPTDADVRVGELLHVPLPLEGILRAYEQ